MIVECRGQFGDIAGQTTGELPESLKGCEQVSYLGFEEVDGDAVVLQTVDSQLAAAGPRQLLFGDELQQSDQSDASLQLRVDVSQLQALLQEVTKGHRWLRQIIQTQRPRSKHKANTYS